MYSLRTRCPEKIRRGLPLATRERVLSWTACADGCRLVVTSHGLWEWPRRGGPARTCWRDTAVVRDAPGLLTIGGDDGPLRHHQVPEGHALPVLARTFDRGSRAIDLSFRLPTGGTVRIEARSCAFEGTLVWRSRVAPATDADEAEDRETARLLLVRAREEYGTLCTDPIRIDW